MSILMLSTQTQTTINSLTGKRGIPYEKISNKRRFQLIKKETQITLKEAAEDLDINYSTAKTIIQTFRREGRLAKIEKKSLYSRKSQKREGVLQKHLQQLDIGSLMEDIMESERDSPPKRLKIGEEDTEEAPETRTLTFQDSPLLLPRGVIGEETLNKFRRISSAAEMVNEGVVMEKHRHRFECEEGPRRIDVGTSIGEEEEDGDLPAELPPLVFGVIPDCSPDEQYRMDIDYQNPMHLKAMHKLHESEEGKEESGLYSPLNSGSLLENKLSMENVPHIKLPPFRTFCQRVSLGALGMSNTHNPSSAVESQTISLGERTSFHFGYYIQVIGKGIGNGENGKMGKALI